jgi:hypothetical protein
VIGYLEEDVSGLDNLHYDVVLSDPITGAPLTSGTVTMRLADVGTVDRLGDSTNAEVEMAHVGDGRWVGTHEASDFGPLLPAVGEQFDRVLVIAGVTQGRLMARCRRVSITSAGLLQQVKLRLRIQTTVEDAHLTAILQSAVAMIEGWLQRPILQREEVFIDQTGTGPFPSPALLVPVTPVHTLVSVADGNHDAIDVATLRLNPATGVVLRRDGGTFRCGPYTITAVVGLEGSKYARAGAGPAITQAIIDVACDLYQRRNPVASRESEGGGVSVDYGASQRGVGADNAREDLLPERVAAALAPYRMLGVG